VRFQLLGPVAVQHGDESLPLGPSKQRSLLVALLLDRGRVVPMERLLEALWDGEPPNSAGEDVPRSRYLDRRLTALESHPLFRTRGGGCQLAPDPATSSRMCPCSAS
jgi:DNA-binding SARP family transcriptional activator